MDEGGDGPLGSRGAARETEEECRHWLMTLSGGHCGCYRVPWMRQSYWWPLVVNEKAIELGVWLDLATEKKASAQVGADGRISQPRLELSPILFPPGSSFASFTVTIEH
jgi:hypothetical protein